MAQVVRLDEESILLMDIAQRIQREWDCHTLATLLLQDHGGAGFIQRHTATGAHVDWSMMAYRILVKWCQHKPTEATGNNLYNHLIRAGIVHIAEEFKHQLGIVSEESTSTECTEQSSPHDQQAVPESVLIPPARPVDEFPGDFAMGRSSRAQHDETPADGITGLLITALTSRQRARLFYMIADDFAVKRNRIIAVLLGERANVELSLTRTTTAMGTSEQDLLYNGLEMWYNRTRNPTGRMLYDGLVDAKCDKGERDILVYRDILKLPSTYKGGSPLEL